MSEPDFSRPRRQAPRAVIILFGENLRRMVQVVAALVFATLYMEELPISKPWLIALGAIILAVFTFIQYSRFRFHVTKEELILEKGVLIRERLSIPLDRIQTVHLSQNLIQQIFQVTGLKIDTAGSGKEELKISALTHKDAKALQEILQKENSVTAIKGDTETIKQEGLTKEKRDVLVRLNLSRLILVGLTENHIRSGLIAVGVLWGYYFQLKDVFQGDLAEQTHFDPNEWEQALYMARPGIRWILLLILFFLIASVLVSMFRTILRYFNLEASIGMKSLSVSSGLLKRNAYSIPLNKIQIMTWRWNLLRGIAGFESVIIKQSKSEESSRNQKVEIPACFKEQTMLIETRLFGEEAEKEMFEYHPHPYYQILLSIIFGLIGIVPAGILYVNSKSILVFLIYAMYLMVMVFWVRQYVKRMKISTNGDLLKYEKGWLFRDRSMLKVYKIQAVKYTQSLFQKRRGTAHLTIYTAGGSLRIPFLPAKLACEMYSYFLYRVELNVKSWM